jgi:hypothetical protein
MRKNKAVLLISGAAAAVICGAVYIADKRLSLGIFAGFFTGLVNYFLIASQVKKTLSGDGNTASKVASGIFFYFLRLLGAAAIIAAVVINVKYFSIAGFLAGFTVCVAVIITAHRIDP